MGSTIFGLNPQLLFVDGPGPVLVPVGGEFQTRFATAYPDGGAYLVRLCPLSPLSPATIGGIEPVMSGYGCDPRSIFV